ncbi:hypothetical protein [Shewanella metallivivens]|uniref:Lipoprotein n=1 Tax=Shewanella metallivivens TaxID=2872342 RepID=A0ABT5TPG0_9GAMM|nr:hypothetical protein [Shewanella metallivivens]MDD8060488.1 hypothetical protein [Shewanella metallivivens]
MRHKGMYTASTSMLFILGVIGLTGCGGGSDDTSPDTGGSPDGRLTGDIVYYAAACDVSQPAVGTDIIVHRKDGSILSQSKVPSTGKFDIAWPSDAYHFSYAQQINGELFVYSRLNVVAGDIGIVGERNSNLDSACSCSDFNFSLSDIHSAYNGYTVYLDGDNKTTRANVCKQDGQFPPVNLVLTPSHDDGLTSYAAQIDVNNYAANRTIYVEPSIFENAANESVLLDAVLSSANSNIEYPDFRTFSETDYGRVNWIPWVMSPHVFPGLFANNFITSSHFDHLGGDDYGEVYYYTSRRHRVTDPGDTQVVQLQQNQQKMLQSTDAILSSFSEDGASNYDLTGIGTGKTLLQVDFGQNGIAHWTIEAPLKGTFPDLDLPTNLQTPFEQITQANLSVMIYGYFSHSSSQYNQFRTKVAELQRADLKTRSDFYDNYVIEQISVDIN